MYPVHKNRHLRRALIGLLIVACLLLAALFVYLRALPEIAVINRSGYGIEEVVIDLPQSRVVFDEIPLGGQSTILHSMRQSDGVYKYLIRFSFDARLAGECGTISNAQLGKRLALIVQSLNAVECRESHGLF